MATALTADAMLAALRKWGITPKFYRDNWRTHNRNAQQGWGPINGFMVHNFGSDATDANSNAYLYNGDLARGMPGPLSQFSITDDGQLWVIGWGTANHGGRMDNKTHALVLRDAMPLDRDIRPTTNGSSPSSLTTAVNPRYVGVEMTYGKAPTPAQRTTVTLLGAALMDALGDGYTGGSCVGHRESTTSRSDPVGIPMWQYRREVNALLEAGPAGTSPTEPDGGLTMADINTLTTQLNRIEQALNGLRTEEAGRYQVDTNRYQHLTGVLAGIGDVDPDELAGKIAAALPASDSVTKDALAAALREVLGSLDTTPEPPDACRLIVDTRPQIERTLTRGVRACVLGIVGGYLLGGALAAVGIVWLTTPKEKS